MKKIIALLITALFGPAALAADFEGKVTMKMTGPRNAPPTMTFSLKDGFSRIDLATPEGGKTGIIFDAAKQEMTILMLDQKMYLTQAMPKPPASGAPTDGTNGNGVEVTAAREKILGYDCVKYIAQAKDGTSEIWVTEQLGPFLGFGGGPMAGGRRGPGGGAPAAQGWEQALDGKKVFPLRVVTTSAGKETFRLEATGVEKASLPAALFYPPTDFRNLGDMMRGMGLPGGIPGLPGGMKPPGGD